MATIRQARCDKCGRVDIVPDHKFLTVKFETCSPYGGIVEQSGSKDLCEPCFAEFLKAVSVFTGKYPRS